MAEITRVSPSEMKDIANRLINELISEWDAKKKALYTAVAELDPMWDGVANDTFNQQWADTEPKYAELLRVMQEYADAIIKAADRYQTTEETVDGIVRG